MGVADGAHRPPMVGRADELSALLAVCADRDAPPALVHGDAGTGKTRLLDELALRSAASGAVVLRGNAVPDGGPLRAPAQALAAAAPPSLADHPRLVPFRAVLARMLPAWPMARADADRSVDPVVALGEAVLELLRVLAHDRRVLVLLDDLHWADRDTLVLLEYLAAGLGDTPVHLVLAARDDEDLPDGLDALRRRSRPVPLRRLDDVQVAALARGIAGTAVAADAVEFLVAAGDGVPFLVEELFSGLVEAGRLHRDPLGWHAAGTLQVPVPGAFTRLVGRRLDGLDDATRTVVRTAALLGGELDPQLLADACDLDEETVATALQAATGASLVVPDECRPRWRHALTRDAVVELLAATERSALVRGAARALTARPARLHGPRLALAADLHRRGGDRSRAAGLLLALGREHLADGVLGAAEDVLARAAELAGPGDAAAGEIAAERSRVLGLGARTDEALRLGEVALRGLRGPAARRLRIQLARACVAAERWDAAQVHLDAGMPDAGQPDADDPERLALCAHVALGRDDPRGALDLAAFATRRGRRDDRPESVCDALEVTGRALRRSDPAASRAAFAEAERLAAEQGLVPWRIRALAELGTHDILGGAGPGRLVEAQRRASEAGMLGTATGLDLQITAATTSIDGHVAALPVARRCAERAARLRLPGPWAHATLFVARGVFWSGETERSRDLLEQVARETPHPVYSASALAANSGYDAWLGHDPAAGAAGLGAGVDALRASAVSNPAPLWGHWALLSTVARPGDTGPLDELRGADVLVQGSNLAALQYGDAVVAARAGDLERAGTLLRAGDAEVAGKDHERLFLHCLMVTAGGATAPFDSGAQLREALARWEPAGEVRLARWCRELLRTLGLRVPRPARDHTAVPPGLRTIGVTGREWEVLQLVAEGGTDAGIAARLHLSPRTVEAHVGSLLAKTGATGRAGLADRVPAEYP